MARIMFHVPKIAFIYFMSFILCSNSIAQKHTFTKNEGEFYSYNTKETIKSKDIDNINFYFTSTIGELVADYVSNKITGEVNQKNIELRKSTII